jgi:hypothetical protein
VKSTGFGVIIQSFLFDPENHMKLSYSKIHIDTVASTVVALLAKHSLAFLFIVQIKLTK